METPRSNPPPPSFVVFWIIWIAILNGLVMIQIFAAGGIPSGPDVGKVAIVVPLLAAGMVAVALGIRIWWIPRATTLAGKLQAMVFGLAVSEGIGIIGALVVNRELAQTRLILFITSVACIICFAPVYAKSLPDDGRFR